MQSDARDLPQRVAVYNRLMDMAARYLDLPHPAARPQLVKVGKVAGNDYNPNKVAPPEMRLLSLSMAKDGQTMPVVVAAGGKGRLQVVDGFHRRNVAKYTPNVRESLAGYLFVVELNKPLEDRMSATIRHNLARGSNMVELTAELVVTLKRRNWSAERIGTELGMESDAVLRLEGATGLAETYKGRKFSNAWE